MVGIIKANTKTGVTCPPTPSPWRTRPYEKRPCNPSRRPYSDRIRHSLKASLLLNGGIFLLLILGDTFVCKTYWLSVVNTPNETKICNFYSLRRQPTMFDATTGLIPREYRTSGVTSTEIPPVPDWWRSLPRSWILVVLRERSLLQPIRSITQIWVVTRHSAVVSRQTSVVCHLPGQTSRSTIWANDKKNSGVVNVIPESRLPFVRISSIYRKTAAKAWNWYQTWFWRNGTQISVWIFNPEKQDYLFRCSVAPGNFPLERRKKSCFIYFPTGFSGIFL